MKSRLVRCGLALTLLVAAISGGCGNGDRFQRTIVTGTITYDGQPIPKGAIWFVPTESVGNQAPTGFARIEDGRFATERAKSPITGRYTIKVTGFDGAEPTAAEKAELLSSDFLGHAIFPEYVQEAEIAADEMTLDLDVPKTRKKGSR